MTFDFRYPTLTGATEREQIQHLTTYIHQLVDQLKWALNSVDSSNGDYNIVTMIRSNHSGVATASVDKEDSVQTSFDELKPLIIKSTDIVDAYYEEINKKLEGQYVAQSDFDAQDTIVEQGTSGAWCYRKWDGGTLECWGRMSVTTDITSVWGSLYCGAVEAVAFPFEFVSVPNCQVSVELGEATDSVFVACNGNTTMTSAPSIMLCKPTSAEAQHYDILYHAIGRYK